VLGIKLAMDFTMKVNGDLMFRLRFVHLKTRI